MTSDKQPATARGVEPSAGRSGGVACVVIGRNEGERLRASLASLHDGLGAIVYVDSGSTDDSLAIARAAGALIVELDLTRPFTAARARNAGFAALREAGALPEFVQFVDGDCRLVDGWIAAATDAITAEPSLGIVAGWLSEVDKDASIYNGMCQFEWRRPVGLVEACGGIMLVRTAAFVAIGGFNDAVIAAEDDELCVRMRQAGWAIRRLPLEMARHDAAMVRFGQWWRRAERTGHGFAQVGDLHPEHFATERRRVWFFGLALPVLAVAGAFVTPLAPLAVLSLYAASYLKTALGLQGNALPSREALTHAAFLTLSKFPNLLGMLTYYWRQRRRQSMQLIEYK